MAEVLILGSGREQSLAQEILRSSEVSRVVVNNDIDTGLKEFKNSKSKPFIIIGPAISLADGQSDKLRDLGYTVFGSSKAASMYEASKSLGTKLVRQANIPHPETFIAEGVNISKMAYGFVNSHDPLSYVIKADGLADGKGVILPDNLEDAREVIDGMLSGILYGGAGTDAICFQKRIVGPEISVMAIVGDGKEDFLILPIAQDHKRLQTGDKGPNTAGMGAYAPVPTTIVNDVTMAKIKNIFYKSLYAMEEQGRKFQKGVLYIGIMLQEDPRGGYAPTVLEYNVRFGGPEIDSILPLLRVLGVDIYSLLRSAAEGRIVDPNVNFSNLNKAAVTVCISTHDYPFSRSNPELIYGLEKAYDDVTVQLAAVKKVNTRYVTDGGRVLLVTGVGQDVEDAARKAYDSIGNHGIHFNGMQLRNDIGWQARLNSRNEGQPPNN